MIGKKSYIDILWNDLL